MTLDPVLEWLFLSERTVCTFPCETRSPSCKLDEESRGSSSVKVFDRSRCSIAPFRRRRFENPRSLPLYDASNLGLYPKNKNGKENLAFPLACNKAVYAQSSLPSTVSTIPLTSDRRLAMSRYHVSSIWQD